MDAILAAGATATATANVWFLQNVIENLKRERKVIPRKSVRRRVRIVKTYMFLHRGIYKNNQKQYPEEVGGGLGFCVFGARSAASVPLGDPLGGFDSPWMLFWLPGPRPRPPQMCGFLKT